MTERFEKPNLEVADVLRAGADAYRVTHPLSGQQAKVLWRLTACRTAALGGHVEACRDCNYQRLCYNSCRDRHCPKCQANQRAAWLEARLERLLPVPYFHVVFTLPDLMHPWMLKNQRRLYGLLFAAASQSLLELTADPKRLGAQVGITSILHTWGQTLSYHPHLHCVVTAGGLTPDGQHFKTTKYLVPVKALGQLFRGKFLAGLRQAYDQGHLELPGGFETRNDSKAFFQWLSKLYQRHWVVYAKAPFGSAEQVFRYLGRYSHRVAISNSRLLAMRTDRVWFRYTDYARGHQPRVMSLTLEEFLRRFLLHVLPKGFVRIRHYGVLASANVGTKLQRCRQLLQAAHPTEPSTTTWADRVLQWTGQDPRVCPHCQQPLQYQPLGPPDEVTDTLVDRSKSFQPDRVADGSTTQRFDSS